MENTKYLDSILDQPDGVLNLITSGMLQEHEDGKMDDAELIATLDSIETASRPKTSGSSATPSTPSPHHPTLRGEGGSGEPRRSQESTPGLLRRVINSVRRTPAASIQGDETPPAMNEPGTTDLEDTHDDSSGDESGAHLDEEQPAASHPRSVTRSNTSIGDISESADIREYVSDTLKDFARQINSMSGAIRAVESRLSNLETGKPVSSTSRPSSSRGDTVRILPSASVSRTHKPGDSTIMRESPVTIQDETIRLVVRDFYRRNLTYSNLKAVRVEKLRQLQESLGMTSDEEDIGPGSWTEKGLQAFIKAKLNKSEEQEA